MRRTAGESKEAAASFVAEKQSLLAALRDEDAKTRKNAALLLGELPWGKKDVEEVLDALLDAYEKEGILFVRPSDLKAVSALWDTLPIGAKDKAKQILLTRKAQIEEAGYSEEEKKHTSEENRLILSILSKERDAHRFKGMQKKVPLLLTTEKDYFPFLMKELKRRGLPAEDIRKTPYGLRVMSEDLSPILSARLYDKIYFIVPIKRGERLLEENLLEAIRTSMLFDVIDQYLEGDGAYSFRISVKLAAEDEDAVHRIRQKAAVAVEEASGGRMYNSPGDYEMELMLGGREDGSFGLYLWLAAFPDHRFDYRKQIKPTSMASHRAATMIEMIYDYLRPDVTCLDPLCGTGTLLIERQFHKKPTDLFGTDVYGSSILDARENAAAAKADIKFIHRDYFTFSYEGMFDEILTEFPDLFHKEKEEKIAFLRSFFEKTLALTDTGALWAILTGEGGLFKQQIRMTQGITFVEEIPFGGHRSIFVLRRK